MTLPFQSTRPVRGATPSAGDVGSREPISIHAPRAGRDGGQRMGNVRTDISIHAPRAGRDINGADYVIDIIDFNPRAPCGARRYIRAAKMGREISIHAPRAGRDQATQQESNQPSDFNPRAPCGARHVGWLHGSAERRFQSTRPVRGATTSGRSRRMRKEFQSTRPVRGATGDAVHPHGRREDFNPRAPCGARRESLRPMWTWVTDFNPRAPCGARLPRKGGDRMSTDFNPRAPCGARRNGAET